tara:strand:- start:778 stop:960 length:183 start_codon:yes stop_codon:yes gene_type:complete
MKPKKKTADSKTIQMKVFLSDQEHRVVRVAAALANVTIKEFMKDAILERARTDTKDINLV